MYVFGDSFERRAFYCVMLLAVQLDRVYEYGRTLPNGRIILFFIGNEGISIVENLGLMGVPMPAVIKMPWKR